MSLMALTRMFGGEAAAVESVRAMATAADASSQMSAKDTDARGTQTHSGFSSCHMPGFRTPGVLRPPGTSRPEAATPEVLARDHLGTYLAERKDYYTWVLHRCDVGYYSMPSGVGSLKELEWYLRSNIPSKFWDAVKSYTRSNDELEGVKVIAMALAFMTMLLTYPFMLAGEVGDAWIVGAAAATTGAGVLTGAAFLTGLVARGAGTTRYFSPELTISSFCFSIMSALLLFKAYGLDLFGNLEIMSASIVSTLVLAAIFTVSPTRLMKSRVKNSALSNERPDLLRIIEMGASEECANEFLIAHPHIVSDFLRLELPKMLQQEIGVIRAEVDRLKGLRSQLEADLVGMETLYTDRAQRALQEGSTRAAIDVLSDAITNIETRSLKPMEVFRDRVPAMAEEWRQAQDGLVAERVRVQRQAEHRSRLAQVSGEVAQARQEVSDAVDRVVEVLGNLQSQLADVGAAQAAFVEVDTGQYQEPPKLVLEP